MSCITWLEPVFTCIAQTIKWTLSHAFLTSYRKKINFRKNWSIFLGFGEKLNYFRDLGSKGKIHSGVKKCFQGFGEINALF